jgi:predicted GNAT superfamily acetyltransferase
MKNISIQDVHFRHLEQVHRLNQDNLPHVGALDFQQMVYLYKESIYFRIAVADEEIAGVLIAFDPTAGYKSPNFLWFKEHYDAFIYIDRIMIARNFRRKGIAFRLYDNLEQFAKERKLPTMACEYNLRPSNKTSRLFHQRYGFKEVGQQETEGGRKTVSLQIKPIR